MGPKAEPALDQDDSLMRCAALDLEPSPYPVGILDIRFQNVRPTRRVSSGSRHIGIFSITKQRQLPHRGLLELKVFVDDGQACATFGTGLNTLSFIHF